MSVTTTQYIKKPLVVDAVRVTGNNFEEIASWCQGEVKRDEIPGKGTGRKYIKVRVHNPKNPRQTKAFVGDWLLYTEMGYKIYTNKAFHESFDAIPIQDDANVLVIGQECFVLKNGSILSWRGTNYIPQPHQTISGNPPDDVLLNGDEVIDGITADEVVEIVREEVGLEEQRGEGLAAPTDEEIELVPATPESIAQAVKDTEAARDEEDDTV
jgi:hypothetical protein